MSLVVQYKKQNDTDRGPTPSVWADCPWDDIRNGKTGGATYWDDFEVASFISTTTADTAQWDVTRVTGGTISYPDIGQYGEFLIDSVVTTAGDGMNVQLVGETWKLGTNQELWFESRCQFEAIATASSQHFVGLHDADTDIIASNSIVVASVDFIGFFADTGTTTAGNLEFQNCIESTAATTQLVVPLDTSGDATTFANATYYKLGFRVTYKDPDNFGSATIIPYVNGVPATKNTTGIPDEAMALSFVAQGSGVANSMTVDWVRIAQLVNP